MQLSVHSAHACTLYSSKVRCFGDNDSGQLGTSPNSIENSSTPRELPIPTTATPIKVVAGTDFTCILADNGRVYCVGKNDKKQLGDRTTTNRYSPVQVKRTSSSILTGVKDIVAGTSHSCAIYGSSDKIYCWGSDSNNKLGWNGTSGVKLMALTNGSTCIVPEANPSVVMCKGTTSWMNKTYQMSKSITKLASASQHFCALRDDGRAKCVGQNSYGQLGTGTTTSDYG